MKILIVAATEFEISPFIKSKKNIDASLEYVITGVGMVATTYALMKRLQEKKYDLLVNVGIAGSFKKEIKIGSVLRVEKDSFSELGAEDDTQFKPIDQLKLGKSTFSENLASVPLNQCLSFDSLPSVSGITVNTVHGNERSISVVKKQWGAEVESMEGAAVFYVAEQESIAAIQVRAISNYVEKRNTSNWKIQESIQNLNEWLLNFAKEINQLKTP